MRVWLYVGVSVAFFGLPALAADKVETPVQCDDDFSECKENCAIEFGGTTSDKLRAKLGKCMGKCNRVERDCRERFFETHRNALDQGALDKSPGSRDVDSDGMPTKTARRGKDESDPGPSSRNAVSEAKPPPKEDDLRDDRPSPRREEPLAEEPRAAKKKDPPPAPELRPDEVPKSSRSALKTDPKEKPKVEEVKREEPAAPPPAAKREEPPPRREEPKKSAGLDSDVRSEDEQPAPAPPPKKVEKREEPKKKEEKKQRALDEWDPDAL